MWNKTKATERLNISYPIIQGPFGGKFSSAKLLAIVSNAGGMGSFGMHAYTPEEILQIDREIKSLTKNTYALNLWVPFQNDPLADYTGSQFDELKKRFKPYFDEMNVELPKKADATGQNFERQVESILKAGPPVVSFVFGVPSSQIIQEFKKRGIILIATATTLEEAQVIEEVGIDLVVASGLEAGGHRGSFLKTAEESLTNTRLLIHQIVDNVKIPVIAAGGISNGKDIADVLKMGAAAAQLGTAFLATDESNATQYHKAKLLSETPFETDLSRIFTGRLARAISNRLSQEFNNADHASIAPFPIQSNFLSGLRTAAIEQGRYDLVTFWSGQIASALKHTKAKDLFYALIEEAQLAYR
ncbi:MAG TPA: nitronate monooxygenase [Ohtaekwangia sp.]|nr:nitronate monooxygenase [Ohtaekwangia sp.]